MSKLRDRLAHLIANAALRHLASTEYAGFIEGSIRMGMASAAVPEMTGKQIHDALLRHRQQTGRPINLA